MADQIGAGEKSQPGNVEGHPERVFYLLTGLSGAGKSLASKFLEDQGFYCVENLPPELIETFIDLTQESRKNLKQILLVCDVRSGGQFKELLQALTRLEARGVHLVIIYLEARDDVLVRRFSETRRRHPLDSGSLIEDIQKERELLTDLRTRSDLVIDTSALTTSQLKKRILALVREKVAIRKLNVVLSSFGYKYGIPVDADLVFDVRFLPNPHYEEDLALLTGSDSRVQEFIFKTKLAEDFFARLVDFLNFLIPEYVAEGKSHLTIAVGCTGGQHRSVAIVERLQKDLRLGKVNVVMTHRDVERRKASPSV